MTGREPFDPTSTAQTFRERIATEPDFAVLPGTDSVTAVDLPAWTSSSTENQPVALQLLALRSADDRPLAWSPGQPLSQLPMADDQYPGDVTTVIVWPDGLAAHDHHANGPRLGRLANFLRLKLATYVRFQPLYTPDGIEKLRRMEGRLRSANISFQSADAAMNPERGVFGTLVPQVWGERAPSLRVTFGMGRYEPRDRYLDAEIEAALFELAENQFDQIDNLVIRGLDPQTGKVEAVNLFSEQLKTTYDFAPDPDLPSMPLTSDVLQRMELARSELSGTGELARAWRSDIRFEV